MPSEQQARSDEGWRKLADDIAAHQRRLAEADLWRARCAKAEAALVALVARLDAGGRPAEVLADLATLLDETREIVPRTGEPPC